MHPYTVDHIVDDYEYGVCQECRRFAVLTPDLDAPEVRWLCLDCWEAAQTEREEEDLEDADQVED